MSGQMDYADGPYVSGHNGSLRQYQHQAHKGTKPSPERREQLAVIRARLLKRAEQTARLMAKG